MTLSPLSRHWPTAAIAVTAAAVGAAIGFGWRSESPLPRVAAMTSLSHDSFAVCTAPIDGSIEGFFILDFETGDLTGGVLNATTSKFGVSYRCNVLKDLGFKGPIYHTHGAVSPAFIAAGGKAVEGALMPTGPMVVAADLPESNPIKGVSTAFFSKYQAKWGAGPVPPFAGYAWDAYLLLDSAASRALKSGKPGTPEFRAALRDALGSGTAVVGTNAVYRYTEADRHGVDERARVLVVVKDGAFRLYQP